MSGKKSNYQLQKVDVFNTILATVAILGFAWSIQSAPPSPLVKDFRKVSKLSTSAKVEYWAKFLMRESKKSGHVAKLGAGPQIEDTQDLNPTKFNNLSFVETVLALARSEDREAFYRHLIAIRYQDGRAKKKNRHQTISTDWLPENERLGVLKDVTQGVSKRAKVKLGELEQKVTKRALASNQKPKQKSYYLTAQDWRAYQHYLPSGTIVSFVRHRPEKSHDSISHQGVMLRGIANTTSLIYSNDQGEIQVVDFPKHIRTKSNPKLIGFRLSEAQTPE